MNESHPTRRPAGVKRAKTNVYRRANSLPAMRFEEQQLTSFSGLVVFKSSSRYVSSERGCTGPARTWTLGTTVALARCCNASWSHILLSDQVLRESVFHREAPLVRRVPRPKAPPSVLTVNRMSSE